MPVNQKLRTLLRFITVIACAAPALFAQSPPTSGSAADTTFHAETHEVLVDVAVADKKGNIPRDLTAQDFKILEDGKDQKITSFTFTGNAAPGRTGKHFLALIFDEDQPAFRDEATRFINQFAGPDLYIAVYARTDEEIHLVQAFTTDPERLTTALRDMQIVGEKHPMRTTTDFSGQRRPEVPLLDRIDKVTVDLKGIHGRKALVLFTGELIWFGVAGIPDPGIPQDRPLNNPVDRQFLQTMDNCNQANVAIYAFNIDASAISSGNWYSTARTTDRVTTNRIRDLADGTGGKYGTPGSNQLASYLGSIAVGQDNYVLGYMPSADSALKNCHKLKVTVDRKGVDVNARDSYCASEPVSPLKPEQRALESRAANGANGANGASGDVSVSMQATWFYPKAGAAIANVAMNIGPAAMQHKGKLHGEIPVLGVAYRSDGSVAARFGDTIDLNFETQAELDDFLKTPYPYSNQLTLPPGSYRLRVIAGAAGKIFGSAEQSLEIPPWGGQTLSASAIALGDHDNPIADPTAELDPALRDGPYRLASQGREFIPRGTTQFHLKQQGLLYFEIYEPGPKPPIIDLSIVDRTKGEQKIDSGPVNTSQWTRPGSVRIPIAMRFPSADLPAGTYTLEVRITHDDGKDEVVRTADFEIR